jgi:hypothetical protein
MELASPRLVSHPLWFIACDLERRIRETKIKNVTAMIMACRAAAHARKFNSGFGFP